MRLRYRVGDTWRERPMEGDGTAFHATVPAGELTGEALDYEWVAEGAAGGTARRSARARRVLHRQRASG